MAILRITLDSWLDLGEPADSDGVAGSPLTGRVTLTPSLDGGGVLTSGAYHSRLTERVKISEFPWSYDLVDPTHAMPTGWGWTVTLTPDGPDSRQSFAVLAPETIEATPQVDGVRTIRLEDQLGLADKLGTGGLVRPLPGERGEPGKPGRGIESIAPDGLVTYTDGGTDSLTLPEGTPGRSVVSITAEEGASDATILYSDGETGTLTLPQGEKGDPGDPPVLTWDGTRLVVDGDPGPDLRGEPGPAPEPSSVTASAVTLPPGSAAQAEVVGDWPDLDYRFGVPKGDPGPIGRQGPPGAVATPGDYQIVGPGRPDVPATTSGAVTGSEPVGCLYVSTDGAGVGAWTWRKRPTGWTVTDGDTGWRDISTWLRDLTLNESSHVALVKRSGGTVTFHVRAKAVEGGYGRTMLAAALGFRPPRAILGGIPYVRNYLPAVSYVTASGEWKNATAPGDQAVDFIGGWETSDPWPATLPG